MTKHIGKDLQTRARFHIVEIDEESGMVTIHQSRDGWDKNSQELQAMPWAELVRGLMDGRFEISPVRK